MRAVICVVIICFYWLPSEELASTDAESAREAKDDTAQPPLQGMFQEDVEELQLQKALLRKELEIANQQLAQMQEQKRVPTCIML